MVVSPTLPAHSSLFPKVCLLHLALLPQMMECTKRVEVLEGALNLQPTAPPLPEHLAQHGLPPRHEVRQRSQAGQRPQPDEQLPC